MKRPTDEQFETAIEWLKINEGEDGEANDCHVVAQWIRAQMDDYLIRTAARRGGVRVADLRRRLETLKLRKGD